MNQDRTKRKLTAIFSADVVGYSRLMEADEAWTIKNLDENKRLIGKFIEEYGGRVIDAIGDNLLAEFNSIINSVECAVKIQQELKKKNDTLVEERRMHFRIGVNLGDVVEEDGRIYGSGVNIASRLEGLAEPGGICISGRTYDHIKTRLGLGYKYLGEHNVKNIDEPIRIYRLLMEPESAGKVIEEKKRRGGMSRKVAIVTILIIVVGFLIWRFYPNQPIKTEPDFIQRKQEPVVSDMKESPKTIAVIPFDNRSSDPEQVHFVDGLTEEIINCLGNISGLHVTSKTSSFAFKDTNYTVKEIAEILEREYILEGAVRKAGNNLRINVQLINVVDDRNLWSETYNRELKDIFEIQEDIADNVADKLKLTLEAFQLVGGTENIEAYELYLNAKGKREDADVSGFTSALRLLDEAILLDPKFALAYAFKAHNHILLSFYGPYNHAIKEVNAGLKAAQKAIEIEPNLGDGYIYLSVIGVTKSDWIEARLNLHKAFELIDETSSSNKYFLLNLYLSVSNFNRAHELLEEMLRNDPTNQIISGFYYPIYGFLGNREQAEEKYQNRNKLLLKGFSAWHDDMITEVRLGSGDVLSRDEIVSSNPIHKKGKGYFDSPEDGLEELSRTYHNNDKLSNSDLSYISMWAAYFGDHEFALEAMEKAVSSNGGTVGRLWYPLMKKVRQLPRFKELVKEIGLVDYWKEYGWPDLCRPVGDDDFVCD
jgi:adenylate cyclase